MITRFALMSIAVLFFSSTASGQETTQNQNVPLNETARIGLEGNWVAIKKQTEEAINSAITAYCNAGMFSKGELTFDWDYDANTYSKVNSVLGDAKGTLAFRFNGPDDLFIAHIPKPLFGGEVKVTRAIELRMDLNGDLVGVTYGHMTEKSPEMKELKAVPWLRYSLIMQRMVNNNTGDTFLFASFPKGPNYEDQKATEMFVKCP